MKYRYTVTLLALIQVGLLHGCGGESAGVATGVEEPDSSSDTSGAQIENTATNADNTATQNSGDTGPDNSDTSPREVQVSPEYGSDDSIIANVLTATDSGNYWASIWTNDQDNGDTLHAAIEIDGIWQTPVSLANSFLDTEIESSEQQIMVAWTETKTEPDGSRLYQLQTRVMDDNTWQPAIELANDGNADSRISDTAMTAMPGNRFALLWTKQDSTGDYIRQLSEWNSDHWSATVTLPPVEERTSSNQLAAAPDGSLSNVYSRSVTYEDGSSKLSYWVQDRIADTWQAPVRIDQVELPLWLTRTSLSDREMDSNASGKQIVAWVVRLSDSFGTRYYGIVSLMRDGPGQPWSSHFELTGNDAIENLQVALSDSGHAAIAWLRETGPGRHELMLSRYTPSAGWLPIESNVLRPEFFPDLPPEPATYYPGSDRITMETSGNSIRLSMVTEVGYIETRSFYYSLQSGEIGFDEKAIINANEISRAYRQQLLSCDSHDDLFRCSRATAQLNWRVTIPSLLQTEQIEVIEIN